jgi:hypothetical protein
MRLAEQALPVACDGVVRPSDRRTVRGPRGASHGGGSRSGGNAEHRLGVVAQHELGKACAKHIDAIKEKTGSSSGNGSTAGSAR